MAAVAATPQCGQWRLPMNIMPKHEAHAMVASIDPQNGQSGASEEIAAPQLGQLRVCASMCKNVSEARGLARAIYRIEGRKCMATSHVALPDGRASDTQIIISRGAMAKEKTPKWTRFSPVAATQWFCIEILD